MNEPQPQPNIIHNGQVWSPEMAATRRTELMNDPKFVESALAGDPAKAKELADLYQISRWGRAPNPPPADAADVMARMSEGDMAREQQRHALWRNQVAPSTPQEEFEFERGEATRLQKETSRRDIEAMKQDKEFVRKLLNGDLEARRKWDRWHWVAFTAREVAG